MLQFQYYFRPLKNIKKKVVPMKAMMINRQSPRLKVSPSMDTKNVSKKMGIKPAIQNSRPKAVCPPDTEILPKEKSVSAPSTTLPDNSDASFLYSAMLEIGKIDSVEEFEKLVRLARVKDLKNLMLLQERSEQEDWLEKIESIYDQDIWQ